MKHLLIGLLLASAAPPPPAKDLELPPCAFNGIPYEPWPPRRAPHGNIPERPNYRGGHIA